MIAILQWLKRPVVQLIGACWFGFALGFAIFWVDGIVAALLAGVIAGNVSVAAAAGVVAFASRRN
ncbi:MAG: hypothetical protein ACR2PA_00220 [Hyphomicrobiaceae bacterium]